MELEGKLGCIVPIAIMVLLVGGGGVYWWFNVVDAKKEAETALETAEFGKAENEARRYLRPPGSQSELIGRYLQAQGGEAQIAQINSIRLQGKVIADGKEIPFSQIKRAPNQSRLIIETQPRRMITTDNGKEVWRSFEGLPTAYRLTGEAAHTARGSSPILSPIWALRDTPGALDWSGQEEIDGVTYYKIEVKRTDRPDLTYWIDGERYLEYRVESITPSGQLEVTTFEDYRKVGWLTIPFHIIVTRDGEIASEIIIEQADLNIGLLSAYFDAPEQMEDWPPKAE
ncbi:MAG: hypothetical protein ACQKBV_09425 [Puniceicoccales bacterium]